MPLPVFHKNEAKAVYALKSLQIADVTLKVARSKNLEQRNYFAQKYLDRHQNDKDEQMVTT